MRDDRARVRGDITPSPMSGLLSNYDSRRAGAYWQRGKAYSTGMEGRTGCIVCSLVLKAAGSSESGPVSRNEQT